MKPKLQKTSQILWKRLRMRTHWWWVEFFEHKNPKLDQCSYNAVSQDLRHRRSWWNKADLNRLTSGIPMHNHLTLISRHDVSAWDTTWILPSIQLSTHCKENTYGKLIRCLSSVYRKIIIDKRIVLILRSVYWLVFNKKNRLVCSFANISSKTCNSSVPDQPRSQRVNET